MKAYRQREAETTQIYFQIPSPGQRGAPIPATAQDGIWQPVGGPGGGGIRSLDVVLDSLGQPIFYEVFENGIFRYKNDEWKLVTAPFEGNVFNDFRVIPIDERKHVLYLATSNGLFSSADEGNHWSDVDSSGFGQRAWRVATAQQGHWLYRNAR